MFKRLQNKIRSSMRIRKCNVRPPKAKGADESAERLVSERAGVPPSSGTQLAGSPRQDNKQVLESTSISEKTPDGAHGRTSTLSLPSVPETGPMVLPPPSGVARAPQAPHPDLLEATLHLDHYPDSEVDQNPDSGLDVGPDPRLDPADRPDLDEFIQENKGQLKLSIYVNSGLLTVNIMEARHLVSKYSSTCNTYVKVGVIPDDYCSSRSKTMLVKCTSNPVYHEMFSFELMPGDLAKRAYVSVCHKGRNSSAPELLGSISFGINNIRKKKKDVSGWYHLLPESTGKKKHQQVAPYYHGNTNAHNVGHPRPSSWGPRQTSKIIRVSLERGRRGGYGFSLTGGCPAFVCRVDPRGPAHIAGTRTGDYLLRVNGENVSTASSDCVGRIIRYSKPCVALEFLRPGDPGTDARSSLWQPGYHDLDSSTDSEGSFMSLYHSQPGEFWED